MLHCTVYLPDNSEVKTEFYLHEGEIEGASVGSKIAIKKYPSETIVATQDTDTEQVTFYAIAKDQIIAVY